MAELYYNHGQYAKAEPLFERALAIREKALSPEHPDLANSFNNLAALYDNQGQYEHPHVATWPRKLRALSASHGPFSGSRAVASSCEGHSG
jgi:tetratricopeptide (TPR) repeat protein